MAGWTGNQPRAPGGKFGTTGAQKAGAASVSAPPTGITIPPAMYQAALKQAAQIIAKSNANAAQLKSMTPAEKAAYHQGQMAQNLAKGKAVKLAAAKKRADAAKLKAARTAAAAVARRPGAVATGRALGSATPARGRSSAPSAPAKRTPSAASGSAVQARLQQYLAGR